MFQLLEEKVEDLVLVHDIELKHVKLVHEIAFHQDQDLDEKLDHQISFYNGLNYEVEISRDTTM